MLDELEEMLIEADLGPAAAALNAQPDAGHNEHTQTTPIKDLHCVPPPKKDSPRHSFIASPYLALALAVPASRQIRSKRDVA